MDRDTLVGWAVFLFFIACVVFGAATMIYLGWRAYLGVRFCS